MIRSILFTLFFLIMAASIVVLAILSAKKRKANVSKKKFGVAGGLLGASLLLTILLPQSFQQVNTGSVAVVRHLGKITGVRYPGTHFDFYLLNSYEIYDTKVQQDKILTSAYSKDGQTMELEVFLQYQVQAENIIDIATEYGSLDALQARIETVTIEKTKAVMSSAEAMTIIQNRASFSEDVSTSVRAGISSDYYVNVKDVVLTNIDFTKEFEKSVEDKVIAEQEKQAAITRAEAQLEVARIEAEKKITEASGNAEAEKIIALAEAEAASSKVIELARSLGFEIQTSYVYETTVVIESSDKSTYSKTVTEAVFDTKQAESQVIETVGENSIKTTTIALKATKNVITYDSEHTKEDMDNLVIKYLEYLAYLEKWNGELPEVVAGDDALSIIVPKN